MNATLRSQSLMSEGPQARNANVMDIPSLVGSESSFGSTHFDVFDCTGHPYAVDQASRLTQLRMIALTSTAETVLRAISDEAWFSLLRAAATGLISDLNSGRPSSEGYKFGLAVSGLTGVPFHKVLRAFRTLAGDLARMDAIVAAQSPTATAGAFHTGPARKPWTLCAAGRNVAIRIPHNFPTINLEWLQALALRRSVLLNPSLRDPCTALYLARALYRAGLPHGSISVCHGDAASFWHLADQVIWPGDTPPRFPMSRGQIKLFHQGRSKMIFLDRPPDDVWELLAHMILQGCGRLCTNPSGLLSPLDAEWIGMQVAERLASVPILSLDDPQAVVPATTNSKERQHIVDSIGEALRRGGADLTARVSPQPLVVEKDGLHYLRPTVLHVAPDDPLFGVEFPFPFVTVASVTRERLVRACRHSMIVSVFGDDPPLIEALAGEPTIDKVFHGDFIGRGYEPTDPHEGYLADFLFQKKAVFPKLQGVGLNGSD